MFVPGNHARVLLVGVALELDRVPVTAARHAAFHHAGLAFTLATLKDQRIEGRGQKTRVQEAQACQSSQGKHKPYTGGVAGLRSGTKHP